MPELQFLKTLIFPRAFMLQNGVHFSIFSNLKSFSVFIINGSTALFSKHGKADVSCEVAHVLTYMFHWRLLLVLNLIKQAGEENKEIEVKGTLMQIWKSAYIFVFA